MNDPETLVNQSYYFGVLPKEYLLSCAINLLSFNPLAIPADLDYYIQSMQEEENL